MITTQKEMVEAKVPFPYKDQCAHLLIPFNSTGRFSIIYLGSVRTKAIPMRSVSMNLLWRECYRSKRFVKPNPSKHKGLSSNPFLLSPKLPMLNRLNGRVAIITGGARGIGEATAKLFAVNGAYVIIADILDVQGTNLAKSIGGKYIHCDVSKEDDVKSAVELALKWKGKLDIIFNNAGIGGPGGSITNLDMEQLMSLLAVNLKGIIHGIKHAARAMIEGKTGGCIICSASSAAILGGLASHAYTLSKAAIVGLAKSTACELGVHRIRVNCVSPHGVPSELLVTAYRKCLGREDLSPEEVSQIVGERASLLRGRGGSFEDVAQAVLFLASDDSGFITGHNLVLDGGYTSAFAHMSSIYQ